MKKAVKYAGTFVAAAVILLLFLYFNGNIGIYKSNIERDARASQKIPNDWKVAQQTAEVMSAMIFYDEGLGNHTFSIYVKREGLSFGYFFRGGGSLGSVMDEVAEFHIEGCKERAFVSMNKQKISKVLIDNGQSTETIRLDSTKPFVFILPVNAGIVSIYDIEGNIVQSLREQL